MKDKYPLYIHKKKDALSGKLYYALEHKLRHNDKQITIHVLTLPPFYDIIKWVTGEVAEDYIKNKIDKRLKVSKENECLEKPIINESKDEEEVQLIEIKSIDTNQQELLKKAKQEQDKLMNEILGDNK